MGSYPKGIICLFLLVLSYSSKSTAQNPSFTLDDSSFGYIADSETKTELGTGFVAGSPRYVITCAHVVNPNRTHVYVPVMSTKGYQLKLEFYSEEKDLALLSSQEDLCKRPIKLGKFESVKPGTPVVYIGLKGGTTEIKVHQEAIMAVGTTLTTATGTADFMEFIGEGVPGYSGGPVLTWNGEVVGIMREAWTKKALKPGEPVLINRAFSINPVAKPDSLIKKP